MTFKENLSKFLSDEEIKKLMSSLNKEDQHALLLNKNKMDEEQLLSLFPLLKAHPIVKNGYLYDKNIYPLGKSIYHELGAFYLQEPSAMSVVSLLEKMDDAFILDMCASPGGKSIQASLINPNSTIIANDLSRARCETLLSNIERLGLNNIVISNNDFTKIYQSYLNYFDLIILDAPCSGSGMFRKDNKMIDDWSINKVYKYQQTQKELIDIAYQMLKKGGYLSYSTCSYSMEENEEVIISLLDKYDDIEIIEIKKDNLFINKKCPIGVRFMPSYFNGEGQYFCLIRKKGERNINKYKNENKYQSLFPFINDDVNILKAGQTYFALNKAINIKPLNVIRYGIKLGDYDNKIYRYDLHLAKSKYAYNFPYVEIKEEEVRNYLLGNPLTYENNINGYVALRYKNIIVDITKVINGVIKNHYPKGLRRKYQ